MDFDWFELNEITKGNCIIHLLSNIFENESYYETLLINPCTIIAFAEKIQRGYIIFIKNYIYKFLISYLDNPYHNIIHAADVCQSVFFLLKKCKFKELANLSKLECISMVVSGIIHDYGHP